MMMQTPAGQRALCIMFGIVTLAPTLLWPTGTALNARLNENRVKAQLPGTGDNPATAWQTLLAFREFYNDNFPFRDVAIEADSRLRVQLAGNFWTDRVILGRDGWMFLRRTRTGVPVTLPVAPFTEAELADWTRTLIARDAALRERGIRYAVIIAPNKATVYPDFRPDDLRPFPPDVRQDQLRDALRSGTRVQYVDLRPALREARQDIPELYYRTDTHWNAFGARAADREIGRQLQLLPGTATDGPFVVRCTDRNYSGDLLRLLGAPGFTRESRIALHPERGFCWNRIDFERAAVPGIPEFVRTFATAAPNDHLPHAVIFRDSFCLELQPFLSERFRRAVYVWHDTLDLELIERESPDLVLDIFVERQLHTAPPAALCVRQHRPDR